MSDLESVVERAFRLRRELLELFEPADAEKWLLTPQPLLSGRRPVELLTTNPGYRAIQTVIAQLRDGVHV